MEIAVKQTIRIIRPGTFCALQDIGRFGYRHIGVPCSGASDRHSMMYVNTLLNNVPETAVLEIFGSGFEMEVVSDCVICFSGAQGMISLNGSETDFSKPKKCHAKDVIKINKLFNGNIVYLGVLGGFFTTSVMDSISYLKDTHLTNLNAGDILYTHINAAQETMNHPRQNASIKPLLIDKNKSLSVHQGSEFDILSPSSQKEIFNQHYSITASSNRMGFRLSGAPLEKKFDFEMITSAVAPGVVQLLPDGQLIILMRDCQTTGGYPRVLLLHESDINQLAQRTVGDKVCFSN